MKTRPGFVLLILLTCATSPGLAQVPGAPSAPPIEPLSGSIVLAGGGTLPEPIVEVFVRLAGGGAARIVLIAGRSGDIEAPWKRPGIPAVRVLRLTSARQLTSERTLLPLLSATGIWLASDVAALQGSALFERLLQGVIARGGVVGGSDAGARALTQAATSTRGRGAGFDVLPRSVVAVRYAGETDDARLSKALARNPGRVGWGIPERTALVVHHGRRVGVVGDGTVTASVAPRAGWPGRRERLEPSGYGQRWDALPYQLDLLAWTRSAQARLGPLFPPRQPPVPHVRKGTLILHGGRRVNDETFARFIRAAGGTDAHIVCIPSGLSLDEDDTSRSYSARELRERGCKNVHVLHTRRRSKADLDAAFLAPLKTASGVWIDGGRTYRLMDAYQHTRAHALMHAVLARGGVVGGSSAGCQVQGDFMMRGKPSSNRPLWWDGYLTGFGFLQGVIIDAHFRQRGRHEGFGEIMKRFPQMLGIGVDENTALVVTGHVGEVVGENAVTFYDHRGKALTDVVLGAGKRYDLEARAPRGD